MKVLITGANGQLGWELQRHPPADIQLDAVDRLQLDLCDPSLIEKIVTRRPDIIINAAAYTAVDRAEGEPERAFAVNAGGAAKVALAAHRLGVRLVHISTDFIFDGTQSCPYPPDATPAPLGVYGRSKLEGEQRVRDASAGTAVVVRTAWVYSTHGSNFVKTILRLLRERDALRVVADQIGTPCWAHTLAAAVWELALRPELDGTFHWTDLGVASWYDFAVAVQEEAVACGLLPKSIPITPILSEEYPTPAQRPSFGVLDKTRTLAELRCPRLHWRVALRHMLAELKEQP